MGAINQEEVHESTIWGSVANLRHVCKEVEEVLKIIKYKFNRILSKDGEFTSWKCCLLHLKTVQPTNWAGCCRKWCRRWKLGCGCSSLELCRRIQLWIRWQSSCKLNREHWGLGRGQRIPLILTKKAKRRKRGVSWRHISEVFHLLRSFFLSS